MYTLVYSRKGIVHKKYPIEPDVEVKTVGKIEACHYIFDYDAEMESIHVMLRYVKDHFEICPVAPCKMDDRPLAINQWVPIPFDKPCFLSEYSVIEIKGGENPRNLRKSFAQSEQNEPLPPPSPDIPPLPPHPDFPDAPPVPEESGSRYQSLLPPRQNELIQPEIVPEDDLEDEFEEELDIQEDRELTAILEKIERTPQEEPKEIIIDSKLVKADEGEEEDKELTSILQKIERFTEAEEEQEPEDAPEILPERDLDLLPLQTSIAQITRDLTDEKITDRYQILRKIGSGAMGEVYEAYDKQLQRKLALKILTIVDKESMEAQRFLREARAVGKLSHPNIVALHDVGEYEGQPFFTMDLLVGKNLQQQREEGEIAPRRAMMWIQNIADALHFAHQHNIVHRDIKPSNIIVTTQGAVLTDFGIAKDTSMQSMLTTAGETLGTPAYMPPEQAKSDREKVNATSDVYSLGAVLYELLTGRPPFEGPPVEVLNKVCTIEPRSVRRFNHDVHQNAVTITMKAMAKEQRYRYQTAGEMYADISRYLDGEPIQGKLPPIYIRLASLAKTNKKISAALIAILLFMFFLTGVKIYHGYRNSVEREQKAQNLLAKAHKDYTELEKKEISVEKMLEIMDAYDKVLSMQPKNPEAIKGKYNVTLLIAERKEKEGKLDFANALYSSAYSLAKDEIKEGTGTFTSEEKEKIEKKRAHLVYLKREKRERELDRGRKIVEDMARESATEDEMTDAALALLKYPRIFHELYGEYEQHENMHVRATIELAQKYLDHKLDALVDGKAHRIEDLMVMLLPYNGKVLNKELIDGLETEKNLEDYAPRVHLFCAKMLGITRCDKAIGPLLKRLQIELTTSEDSFAKTRSKLVRACVRSLMVIEGGEETMFEQTIISSMPKDREYLFTIDKKYTRYLHEDRMPDSLRQQFESEGCKLSYNLKISREREDGSRVIVDPDSGRSYWLVKREEKNYVYDKKFEDQLNARKCCVRTLAYGGRSMESLALKIMENNFYTSALYQKQQNFPILQDYFIDQERNCLKEYFVKLGSEALPALKKRLHEGNSKERAFVIKILRNFNYKLVFPTIKDHANSENREVRIAAFSTLQTFVDRVKYVESDDVLDNEERRHRRQDFVDLVRLGLEDEELEVQKYTVKILGSLKDKKSAPQMLDLLVQSFKMAENIPKEQKEMHLQLEQFQGLAVNAIGRMGPGASDKIEKFLAKARGAEKFALLDALGRINPQKAIPLIVPYLSSHDEKEYNRAVGTLRNIGDAALDELNGIFSSGNAKSRRDILWATDKIKGKGVFELYARALDDPQEEVAIAAIEALSQRREKGLSLLLKALLYKADDDKITIATERALGNMGEEGIPMLKEILLDPRRVAKKYKLNQGEVRARIVKVFATIGRPALSHVLPLLEKDNLEIRPYVLEIIGKTGHREDAHHLIQYLFDPQMTNKIKQILIKDMKNAAVPQLISMWKQGELSLREQGILLEVLAKIGNKDAFPIFFGLLEDDRFREQTITAMENMESYALPELIKALADPIKREGAAQALSKMPEAAMGPLREILKNSQESVAIRSQIPLIIVNMHRDKQAVSIFDDILENSQNANIYLPVWKAMGKVRKPVPRVVKIIDKLKRIDPGAREILLEKKNRKEAVSELSRYWKKYITAKNPKANQVSMLEGIINEITQKDEGAKRIWINRLLSYFRGHKKLRMEMANRLGNINWNNVRPSIKKNTASTLKRYLNDKNPQLKSKVTGILNVIDSEKKWH